MSIVSVILFLILAGQVPAVLPLPQGIPKIIQQFETASSIEVSAGAETRLTSQIPIVLDRLRLMDNLPPAHEPKAYRAFVTESLAKSYLFWSRERRTPGATLGVEAVTDADFAAFVATSVSLTGHPVGRLEVTSSPDRADIDVDGRNRGMTENAYLVTAGIHTVVVKPSGRPPCSQTVTIATGETKKVDCR